jgi:hypothetical protein
MLVSRTVNTVDFPIPSWKGPLENGIDEILVVIEDVPPLSGGVTQIPISDALTVAKDARVGDKNPDDNVVKFELVTGTVYDDQERIL